MKILLSLLLLVFSLFASQSVSFKKGWSLMSLPEAQKSTQVFENKNVELVWAFDARSQEWQGYSPDAQVMQKIKDANLSALDSLKAWQAFWIFNNEDWSADIKEGSRGEIANGNMVLEKGWNLVSLPQRAVADSSFFGDALVWKYRGDGKWSVNDATLDFPTIKNINESEGLWVKSDTRQEIAMDKRLSELQNFDSKEEMENYIREMLKANRYYGGYGDIVYALDGIEVDTSIPVDDAQTNVTPKSVDTTTTNLQEAGVDEADILKNDGEYIFSVDREKSSIFITSFENIAKKEYAAINTITTKDKDVVAMYLQDKRLILLSRPNNIYTINSGEETGVTTKAGLLPYYDTTEHFYVDIYNVLNVNDIKLLETYTIDGSYQTSRLVDGRLFVVSAFQPQIEYAYDKVYVDTLCNDIDRENLYASCSGTTDSDEEVVEVMPDLMKKAPETCEYSQNYELYYKNECYKYNYDATGAWEYDYENPRVVSENLTPSIATNGVAQALITPERLYAPIKLNQDATLTTLSSFNIDDATYKESISYVGSSQTYYASKDALYLVSAEYPLYYNYIDYEEQQMIYKFSLGESLAYKAKGSVDGRMLNQFSMSEQGEYLRVATSSGFSWGDSDTNNTVSILNEQGSELQIVSELGNLGKKGELIKAVRFMGDRGFVVTFKETDPLYTLDLSDALHPKVAGELSIPGFSRYLHIVDTNRVLSIGRDVDSNGRSSALTVQLFDISDFANPQLADKIVIGSASTYSSAEYDHKAFVYRESDKSFGFPYVDYSNSSNSSETHNFGIYRVDDMKITALKTLSEKVSNHSWGYNDRRGIIFDLENKMYGVLFNGSSILSDEVK